MARLVKRLTLALAFTIAVSVAGVVLLGDIVFVEHREVRIGAAADFTLCVAQALPNVPGLKMHLEHSIQSFRGETQEAVNGHPIPMVIGLKRPGLLYIQAGGVSALTLIPWKASKVAEPVLSSLAREIEEKCK